jgi:hypothetical protein
MTRFSRYVPGIGFWHRQPQAVRFALAGTLLGLIWLQLWRPFYFLCDDNLVGAYPAWVEFGRSLWTGRWPFYNPYLFGGFDTMRDPGGIGGWNPWLFIISGLALTPARLAIVDVMASFQLLLCAFAFSHLLVRLRELYNRDLSDGRIVLLSLSYTFSIWAIVIGSSWITFLGNQAALPVLFLGLLHERRRAGVALTTCSFLHAIVAGHLSSFILSLVLITFFIAVYCVLTRTGEMAFRWASGGLAALLLISPLLYIALQGFGGMGRSGALPHPDMLTMPLPVFITSYFIGFLASLFGEFGLLFVPRGLSCAVACTFASWCIFHSWGARKKWSPLEIACIATAALTALFIVRPHWLTEILSHLPLLRSLRFPFREIFVFLFFVHLWIALRPVTIPRLWQRFTIALGIIFYAMPFFIFKPPAFTPYPLDRHLLRTGEGERYWKKVRPLLQGKPFVPILEPHIATEWTPSVPWLLLGAYNYPSLIEVPSKSGYVIAGMTGLYLNGVKARGHVGSFRPADIPRLRAAHPDLKFIVLKQIRPLRIELYDGARRIPLPAPTLPPLTQDKSDLQTTGPRTW